MSEIDTKQKAVDIITGLYQERSRIRKDTIGPELNKLAVALGHKSYNVFLGKCMLIQQTI
jgi:hypothetical protein